MKPVAEEVLPEIVRRLVDEFDPEQIILFGSRAWGEPQTDSDYDVLVVVTASDEKPTRRATRGYRCLRKIGVPIDLIVKTRGEFDRFRGVAASLEAEISRRGRILYGRGEAGIGSRMAQEGVS
jgi:predicted nucleotidyltransferase